MQKLHSNHLAYEQAHLVCYSREYLGGGAAICETAGEASRREE